MSPPENDCEQMSIDRSLWRQATVRNAGTGTARTWLLALVALIAIGAAALAVLALRNLRATSASALPALRLALLAPEALTIGGGPDYPFGLSLAPDGRQL